MRVCASDPSSLLSLSLDLKNLNISRWREAISVTKQTIRQLPPQHFQTLQASHNQVHSCVRHVTCTSRSRVSPDNSSTLGCFGHAQQHRREGIPLYVPCTCSDLLSYKQLSPVQMPHQMVMPALCIFNFFYSFLSLTCHSKARAFLLRYLALVFTCACLGLQLSFLLRIQFSLLQLVFSHYYDKTRWTNNFLM